MPEKKMGRPTDNPKTTQFSIRFDEDTLRILDEFCAKEKITRPQGVRIAENSKKNKKENIGCTLASAPKFSLPERFLSRKYYSMREGLLSILKI